MYCESYLKMSGKLLSAEHEKFILWAKDFAKQNFIRSVNHYARKRFRKEQGIFKRLITFRNKYNIVIDWETINVDFLGFGDLNKRIIEINGQELLDLYRMPNTTQTEWEFTQYADVVGIIGFGFLIGNFSVSIESKKNGKTVATYNIESLQDIMKDNSNMDRITEDSTFVMVVFGHLHNLRKIKFKVAQENVD